MPAEREVPDVDVHLRDLRYFVAVAEERHFTRAAQRLFISQPALSRQISKLERDLRVTLIVRDHRNVTLTAAGETLLEQARPVLAGWDATRRAVSDSAAFASAVVRIGIQTSVGRGLLAHLQDTLQKARPGWRLEPVQIDWSDPTCGLADGTVDAAVAWLPMPAPDSYRWIVLASEPRHVALPTDHRLACEQTLSFVDIRDEAFVALPESAGTLRDFWLATDYRDGQPARIAATARNADETFEIVGAGLGVALLAAGNAALYRRPGIVDLLVVDLKPAELALVWNADDGREVIRALTMAGPATGS